MECEINLNLKWSWPWVIINSTDAETFAITDTKLNVSVITLSTQNLLQQLKLGFKRTIDWNKYQSKGSVERQNQNLDYLIDLSFQGVNRLFVLSFEDCSQWIRQIGYFLQRYKWKSIVLWSMDKNSLINQ